MDRACLTVDKGTAARLRDARLDLSYAASDVLTVDGAINYLLDHWMATHPHGQVYKATRTSEQARDVA